MYIERILNTSSSRKDGVKETGGRNISVFPFLSTGTRKTEVGQSPTY